MDKTMQVAEQKTLTTQNCS